MANQDILLKDAKGNNLYPQTRWNLILDKPAIPTAADITKKQDQLTAANAGVNVSITTEGGVLKINATALTDYANVTNKPSINGFALSGNRTSGELQLPLTAATSTGDYEIADAAGNVILRIKDGNLATRHFDSTKLPTKLSDFQNDLDYITVTYHDSQKQDAASLKTDGVAAGLVGISNVSDTTFTLTAADKTVVKVVDGGNVTIGLWNSGNYYTKSSVDAALDALRARIAALESK